MKKENPLQKMAKGYRENLVTVFNEKNRHLFTEEGIYFFEKAERGELFSPKFLRMQNETVEKMTREAFQKDPAQPVKKVAIAILETLPDRLPDEKLSELFQLVLKEWRQLKEAHLEPA